MATPKRNRNRKLWAVWLASSALLCSWFAWGMFGDGDKTAFMPGPMTDGHHSIAERCELCHSEPEGGGEILQDACIDCHGPQREKPFDSHPRSKFKDPRNADRLEKIDALHCVSCHREHQPEITLANGLTQPRDVCAHCHIDIGEDRPSHQNLPMDSCKNSGCHNFHNNRALYTDFLVKHHGEPNTKQRARVKAREFADVVEEILEYPRDRYPLEALSQADDPRPLGDISHEQFLATAHAKAGVNCSACHRPLDEQGQAGPWQDKPGTAGCKGCHDIETQQFGLGKHGMREAAGLGPMRADLARIPMRPKAVKSHQQLNCSSCHDAHDFNTQKAAVDACLGCHNDRHSLAYKDSKHFQLWQASHPSPGQTKPAAAAAPAAETTGVSCATCHMPRVDVDVNDWMSRIVVNHNQNATLSPNSKMIRPACLQCHGLGYSIDALADQTLIDNNFQGQPAVHIDSMDMAYQDQQRYLKELAEQARQQAPQAGSN